MSLPGIETIVILDYLKLILFLRCTGYIYTIEKIFTTIYT
jgi:hypothetical protein